MKIGKCVLALSLTGLIAAFFLIGCSNGSSSPAQAASQGTVNVTLSDPPTCRGTSVGQLAHIYVTIVDVSIHTSATAGNNDAGWVDLTPNLSGAPQQVDLLNIPTNGCFLATLGTAGVPAGTYQQIRLKLASTGTPADNPCGVANCVVPASGAPSALRLSSEATTGIKIPSGQLAGGKFTIGAGETKGLNIDFDGCASVLMQMGTGQYFLKPVLHAGEVSTVNSSAIVGRLVDLDGHPILGTAFVALEQSDGSVDRVIKQIATDPATGQFVFCPIEGTSGSFDLVAVAITAQDKAYGPTMVTGISPGTTVGDVKLTPAGTNNTPAPPATFGGQVATAPADKAVGIEVSMLQNAGTNNTPITIPGALSASPPVSVASFLTSGGTGSYSLAVPAATVLVGAFSSGSITWGAAASLNPTYTVEARAFVGNTTTPNCSAPNIQTTTFNSVAANSNNTANFSFAGCQ